MPEARLCACGCGAPTPLASRTDRRYGQVKGEPVAYVPGHNPRGKGWNLRKGSAQRGVDEAVIRQRWKDEQRPAAPEPEPEDEASLDGLSANERQREVWAFQELRRRLWETPVLDASGSLGPRPLPSDYVLDWESIAQVVEEVPDYRKLGWRVEESPLGLVLIGPGRLPQLVAEDEIVPLVFVDESVPVRGPAQAEPEPVEVQLLDGVAVVAPSTSA